MDMLATIPWGYVTVALLVICALVASPVFIALLRTARAIGNTASDDFRLGNANMWTEAHHVNDKGSFQVMRLKDDNFVFISVGLSTVKVFVTPDRTDMAHYRELKEFSLLDGAQRLHWVPSKRRAQDLLILARVRSAIAWPTSEDELSTTLDAMDTTLLLDPTLSADE